jgi:hypothetical protein|tara:strand:+ start:2725 stop:3264 length:540 start_codon:yes stop_codon:yes gene_type:complete
MIGEWRSNEYIEQNINEDLQIGARIGYLSIEGENIVIKNENKNSFKQITFMAQLMQSFIDSYFIVLHAINTLMERGSVVQKKYILNDLHHCVQEIHYQGATPFLNACVIETLDAAFHRFAQLGVCDLKAFDSAEGPQVVYLKCTPDKKQEVERYYNILEAMSSSAGSHEKQRILEVEIQ